MTRTIKWVLVAVNAVLGLGLVIRLLPENQATAQIRRPADYLMIPGEVTGANTSLVYVIDSTNGMLGGVTFDDNAKELQTMPPVDLGRVFDSYVAPGANRRTR